MIDGDTVEYEGEVWLILDIWPSENLALISDTETHQCVPIDQLRSAFSTLADDLAQFSGTDNYYGWSSLFRFGFLTDGTKHLAEKAGAYWLMDAIASWQVHSQVRREPFQVWRLQVDNRSAVLVADDGNGKVVARQVIEYTDFPLDEIKLYAEWISGSMVILLPGEH